MYLITSTVFIQRNHVKVQAAVRSVWVSSLNVIGGENKSKVQMLWVSHKANLKVAKIVISRMNLSKVYFARLVLKATVFFFLTKT